MPPRRFIGALQLGLAQPQHDVAGGHERVGQGRANHRHAEDQIARPAERDDESHNARRNEGPGRGLAAAGQRQGAGQIAGPRQSEHEPAVAEYDREERGHQPGQREAVDDCCQRIAATGPQCIHQRHATGPDGLRARCTGQQHHDQYGGAHQEQHRYDDAARHVASRVLGFLRPQGHAFDRQE